jgi:hypothetical protein
MMMEQMKKSGVLFLLLCTMVGSAAAMFTKLSDEELIAKSALIVVGELIGRASIGAAENAQMLGVIRVEETLKGEKGVTIAFLALPGTKLIQRSDDLTYRVGQFGLWYLRLQNENEPGVYVADHPQRFVPMDKAGEQIEFLRKHLAR